MSAFEKFAVQRLIRQAEQLGVDIPDDLRRVEAMCFTAAGTTGARLWVDAHPQDDTPCGCWGYNLDGPAACTCWEPVFDVEQAPPRPLTGPQDLQPRDRMCGDCAFRPGSPERADSFSEEALLELARTGDPFWCHQGMRRPAYWRHPDGRTVPGSPDDYQPAALNSVPYQADGSPGLLCAGWAAVAAKTREQVA